MTVAVMQEAKRTIELDERDIEITPYRASGPGGQHRNKTQTAIRATHIPTGVTVCAERERSQWQNRRVALEELAVRIEESLNTAAARQTNDARTSQIGMGDRVSHDWTWCAWRDSVTRHDTGKKAAMSAALRGRLPV